MKADPVAGVGRLRRQDGFTFVEALTVIALLGIVLPGLVALLRSSVRWGDTVENAAVEQTEARAAVDRLAADLRQAYTGDATPAVETATPAEIVFYSPDRATPFHLRRIAYRLADGTLERSSTPSANAGGPPWSFPPDAGWIPAVRDVLGSTAFAYLDANGDPTTDPTKVHEVDVALTVANPDGGGPPLAYATSVALRTT